MELSVNWLAVLVAAVVSYGVGAVWHGPLFGKKWIAMQGFTPEKMKSMPLSAKQAMSLGFVFTILMSFGVALFAGWLNVYGVMGALNLAFWVWAAFIVPMMANGWLWEGKSFNLFLFNSVYQFISFFVMSLILTLWK